MKWSIVTDSSCDFCTSEKQDILFSKVPFTIGIGNMEYTDDSGLNVEAMLDDMENSTANCHTACPSPAAYMELFEQADNTIAITISAQLSGSYNSAVQAKNLVLATHPDKKIFVLNSRSAGSALTMYVEKAIEYIEQGSSFEAVAAMLEVYALQRHTIFALSSFNNLIKNGRISKLAGFVAGKLGLWGIGIGNKDGKIEVKGKVRGTAQVIDQIIKDMRAHMFVHGPIVISHCQNPQLAEQLRVRITEIWKDAKIKILSTGGLCSFYAERKGLIIAY